MPPNSFTFFAPSSALSSTILFFRLTTPLFRRSTVTETSRGQLPANDIAAVGEGTRGPRRPRRCAGGDTAVRPACHVRNDEVAVRAQQWCTRARVVLLA